MIPQLSKWVLIGGQPVNVRSIHTIHDVDHPIGTGELGMGAPIPKVVDFEAPVEVYAGWDGQTSMIFRGQVSDVSKNLDLRGRSSTIKIEGNGRRLRYASGVDHYNQGPVRLDQWFRSVCHWRGVPAYGADVAFTPSGGDVILGTTTLVNDGRLYIRRNRSPLQQLSRVLNLFGYKHFDTPQGVHHMQLVSGMPDQTIGNLDRVYSEGVDMRSVDLVSTLSETYNQIIVRGAQYKAADTSERAIRSIPALVVTDPRFGPEGVSTWDDGPFEELDSELMAQAVRQTREIDYGGETHRWGWRVRGDNQRRPGEQVGVFSPTMLGKLGGDWIDNLVANLPVALWLMRVEHTINDRNWNTDLEGWAGYGQERPAGNDSVFYNLLGPSGRHLGNEYLAHYRRPNPDGYWLDDKMVVDIPFTVPEDYSTLTIRGWAHGVNSFVGNQQSEVSRFEIWQTWDQPDRAVASGNMPRFDENLEQRIPYGEMINGVYTGRGWGPLTIPLTGSLKAGAAFLRIISAKDTTVGDYDDYEVRDLVLEAQGAGTPIFV